MSKFTSKGRDELGSSVRDSSVMKIELGEYMVEKDVGNVSSRGSFVARAEIYPLRKAWSTMTKIEL